jgi:hypothetical protein
VRTNSRNKCTTIFFLAASTRVLPSLTFRNSSSSSDGDERHSPVCLSVCLFVFGLLL